MHLDYSKLDFQKNGQIEQPELMLRTLSGEVIGILPLVHNLKFTIKFSEPSEISFTVPRYSDGRMVPFFDDLVGYKVIWTEHYGVYLIMNPEHTSDGIEDVMEIKGYSLEKALETKKFFLEEGTFNFWNPAAPTDTIMQRILEIAIGWKVGYVSPKLIGMYRTFDQYDDFLLSFVYNTLPEKYRCVFVFDTYDKTISVYDADEERTMLPIYLSFDNLVESIEVEEKTDELVTALRPYGSDDLDIRNVNPTGTNWIYDLSWFIANGDIPDDLAQKWEEWQRTVLNRRQYYSGLVALRYSATSRLFTAQAKLTDLKGELTDLTNQQSVIVQTIADEITEQGKRTQQQKLDDLNRQIAAKKNEIAEKEAEIKNIENEISGPQPESYDNQIQAIVDELSLDKYFTENEREILSHYFIEEDMTESTFVVSDIDPDVSGTTYDFASGAISVNGTSLVRIDLQEKFSKYMYTLSGGTFSVAYAKTISGDIIRGTLERANDGSFVLSMYCGALNVEDKTAQSGVISVSGKMTGYTDNVVEISDQEVASYEGSQFSFNATSAQLFLTANASDYQRYSVQLELYDYAAGILKDKATPTYEFSVDSANFIFAQEFWPFREKLKLGEGVYLKMASGYLVKPYIIEFEIDFENLDDFSITFSNRFKRHDSVNTLKDMLDKSYS